MSAVKIFIDDFSHYIELWNGENDYVKSQVYVNKMEAILHLFVQIFSVSTRADEIAWMAGHIRAKRYQ